MSTLVTRRHRRNRRMTRSGAAAVEFALVAPLFLLLLLGIIEFGRGLMVQQMIINATRHGARQAVLPGATVQSVKDVVVNYLANSSVAVPADRVTVTPDPSSLFNNEQVEVSVSVPYSDVQWIPASFLGGVTLNASTSMRSERID